MNILQDAITFFTELFDNFKTGVLFFGGPFEIALAILDIAITTLIIYYLLRLIRDSRAWQLLKGLLFIVILAQFFSLLGFQAIGYLLSNTLSVLAIALVVLFQPELRRALETVGRSSFNLITGMVNQDSEEGKNARYSLIDSIVRACDSMAKDMTGALIIIERETRLGELIEQDNTILVDSVVSASLLTQIFHRGSPLHDGAVLIRDGRIHAAKLHVPLSDNYHLRKEYGTRHRAAIGVSEMGDAIAVVVSEERGVISVAIGGRLFPLENADALRTILHRQLGTTAPKGVIRGIFASSDREIEPVFAAKTIKKNKLLMFLSSLLIAVFLWLYVLITINPLQTKEYTIALTPVETEMLTEHGIQYEMFPVYVSVLVAGRTSNLKNLTVDDLEINIDVSDLIDMEEKNISLTAKDVKIKKWAYFEVKSINPSTGIKIKVRNRIDP